MLLSLLVLLALPIGLLCWLTFAPAKSVVGYIALVLGCGTVLLALALAGLWMLLPWWLPWFYGIIWLAVVTIKIVRQQPAFTHRWPSTFLSWIGFLAICALGAYGGYLSWEALLGRNLPSAGVANIQLPLGPGTYLIANGGSREVVNGHLMTLNPTIERFRAYRGQSYGVDLIKIDGLGLRARRLQPRDPSAYEIYGEPVYAPCSGEIIASRNDRPDMPVPEPDREVIEGNHVILGCEHFVLLLAHFQPGSVLVQKGEHVSVGEQVGVVGNSGNTTEPHLHISAQLSGSPAEPLSGEPLAITFNDHHPVRNDRITLPN